MPFGSGFRELSFCISGEGGNVLYVSCFFSGIRLLGPLQLIFIFTRMKLLDQFSKITGFVFDVDGVMTDGSLIIMPGGEFLRTMNIKDGYALQLAVKKGYEVVVISGSHSAPVAERLSYLGIQHIFQKINNKKACLEELAAQKGYSLSQFLFMGDDLPDLEVMQSVGLAACPADAVPEIKNIAHYTSTKKGGEGCVREVIEKVMRLRNDWAHTDTAASK
jgi:3-deoxy-D-manno-octulosonate 8-phosphate phosphatase (KDO 8-P phosphatase)